MNDQFELVAYNTSFANDAHWTQLHPGLSESAAIVAKAIEIYKHAKKKDNPATFEELETYFMNEQYYPTLLNGPLSEEYEKK